MGQAAGKRGGREVGRRGIQGMGWVGGYRGKGGAILEREKRRNVTENEKQTKLCQMLVSASAAIGAWK